MVEKSRAIRIYLWRSLGIDIKNIKSIFRDDHRQKQPENFKLKRNGFFQAFFLLLSLLRSLRLKVMVLVQLKYTRSTKHLFSNGDFNFTSTWNDTIPLLSTTFWLARVQMHNPPRNKINVSEEYFKTASWRIDAPRGDLHSADWFLSNLHVISR